MYGGLAVVSVSIRRKEWDGQNEYKGLLDVFLRRKGGVAEA